MASKNAKLTYFKEFNASDCFLNKSQFKKYFAE